MKLHKRGDGDAVETAPLDDNKPKSKKKSEQSVIIYVTILFTVAFLLVLLSYFMQQRRNEDTISDINKEHTQITMQAQQNIEKLQTDNLKLQGELTEAAEERSALEEQIGSLEKELSELKEILKEQGELNIEQNKTIVALELFIDYRFAYMTKDEETLASLSESMEDNKEYLPETYANIYNEILEEIKNTEVE